MRIDIVTLFPGMFSGALDESIIARARAAGLVTITLTNPRDFATDKHHKCDDRPFGGGAGMVMLADPLAGALEALAADAPGPRPHTIFLTPAGAPFRQEAARRLAAMERLVLVCGRYEGIDQRVVDAHADEELSIGDYVLSGGEPAALVVVDAVVRLLPGALGHADSAVDDSFSPGREGLLDHPHYTRPEVWRGHATPDVLLSGHHANVARWRREQSLRLTRARRPELLARATLTKHDRKFLAALEAEEAAAAAAAAAPALSPADERAPDPSDVSAPHAPRAPHDERSAPSEPAAEPTAASRPAPPDAP